MTGAVASNLRFQIGAGVNWANYDTITGVGDWNHDDVQDLIARTPTGSLYLYRGMNNGQVDPNPQLIATGWDVYDQIIGPVDWSGDGLPGLIARKPDGSMWISLQQPDHSLAPAKEMTGTDGWDQYSTIVGGGGWTDCRPPGPARAQGGRQPVADRWQGRHVIWRSYRYGQRLERLHLSALDC